MRSAPMHQTAATPAIAPTDGELMELARRGDDDATVTLLGRYRSMLLARIQGVHDVPGADADDVLQDVCQRVVRYRARLQAPAASPGVASSARPFLATLAERASMDYHRRRRTERRAMGVLAEESSGAAPDAYRQERALVARLDARLALEASKGRCRQLLTSLVLGGATHAEYARETGTPRGTIGTTLQRCLEKARARLRLPAGGSSRAA